MSLITITSRALSTGPAVWIEGDELVARTSGLVQVLALGSYCREVRVDRAHKEVRILTRWLWGVKNEERIPFQRIARLEYEHFAVPTGISMAWWSRGEVTDQVESFGVNLVLRAPFDRVRLVNFSGEGSKATGWRGILLAGDSLFDWRGTQQEDSLDYVEELERFTGVTFSGEVRKSSTDEARCRLCGRSAAKGKVVCEQCETGGYR